MGTQIIDAANTRVFRRQPAPRQPPFQPFPPAHQPAFDRPQRPTKLVRRLLVREALERAQQDRQPLRISQPIDFIVHHRAELVAFQRINGGNGHIHVAILRGFPVKSPMDAGPGPQRNPPSHPMQPPRQCIRVMNRSRPPRQQQERDLKGILGEVPIRQHMPADAKHHRPMPLNQGGKSHLRRLSAAGKQLEQPPIRHGPEGTQVKEHPDLLAEGAGLVCAGHKLPRRFVERGFTSRILPLLRRAKGQKVPISREEPGAQKKNRSTAPHRAV